MNYYLMRMSTLTPEIGAGVFGGRTRAFDIAGTNAQAITECYDAAHMNVAYGDASLKWFLNWHSVLGAPLVKTLVAGGIVITSTTVLMLALISAAFAVLDLWIFRPLISTSTRH